MSNFEHFLAIISKTVQLWIQVFCVISVYFNIRNTLPNSGTYLIGHPVQTHTGCNRRNVRDFSRVFLRSNYTDITQNTYIQSSMVTEILVRESVDYFGFYVLYSVCEVILIAFLRFRQMQLTVTLARTICQQYVQWLEVSGQL